MARSEETAFLEAFEAHADGLFRHASLRLSSRERATDITQDAFLKAWNYIREGGEVRQWKSFLYRVLNNLIIDEYRRTKEESLDAMLEDETRNAEALLQTGGRSEKEQEFDDARMIEKVREEIKYLSDAYRSVITLRYVDGFSPKEIASSLNLSENVVSVRIHRGLAELKKRCNFPTSL